MRTLYRARHALPVGTPPVEDAAILVRDGRIEAVGRRADVEATAADASDGASPPERRDLGDVVAIPGLVNAHAHVVWSWIADEAPPPTGDVPAWVRAMIDARDRAEPAEVERAARRELEWMRKRGTAALGDVSNDVAVGRALAASGLSGLLFLELIGFAPADAERLLARADAALGMLDADGDWRTAGRAGRWRAALAPHAPHTVSAPLLRALAGRAADDDAPLSIHVAESAEEVRFLRDGDGPFAALLRERGALPADWRAPGLSPVARLHRLGLLTPRTLAIHCVHVDRADRALLQAGGATVVTCPRSNETLGVGRAPVVDLLREGVPVALGTDSRASAPDLDLFAELAALLRAHPTLSPAAGLRIATHNGARALGLAADFGTIAPGRRAELVAVPLDPPGRDPLEAIADVPADVRWIDEAAPA